MTQHQGRHFLQIPGPSPVPDRVLRAMDKPVIDHRSAEFAEQGKAVFAGCQNIFQTKGPVIIFPSSGTGAWEAAIVNTLSPGDKVLMVETGHLATLWQQMAARWGIAVDFMPGDWRHGADPAAIEQSRLQKAIKVRAENMIKFLGAVAAALSFVAADETSAQPFADPRSQQSDAFNSSAFISLPRDPACFSDRLTSTGGPAPQHPHTLAVRWTGFSNFELAYKGKIILLDAYFDRGRDYPPLGFTAADVKKADAIIIGHGHYDHMSDAASVGIRTGAPLVSAPLTTDVLKSEQVPASQIKTVTGKGGELLPFDGFTVQPILARHGQPDKHVVQVMEGAYNSQLPKPDPEAEAEEKAIAARGTFDPRVVTEGTIAYLITLDDGFRIMYRDSGGHVTDEEKAAMEKLGGVDLALVGLSADILNVPTEQQALEHVKLYKPDVFMPAHHDGALQGHMPLWRATEPVFQALKDADPGLVTVSRGYREPVCFNTEINIASGRKR